MIDAGFLALGVGNGAFLTWPYSDTGGAGRTPVTSAL